MNSWIKKQKIVLVLQTHFLKFILQLEFIITLAIFLCSLLYLYVIFLYSHYWKIDKERNDLYST